MRLIDLHTHTTLSDGTDPPAEVVRRAARLGLAAVAITDHDTADGLPEALAEGRDLDLEVVPGVELGVEVGLKRSAHLVGLWLDPTEPRLAESLVWAQGARRRRNLAMIRRLAELGWPLDLERLNARAAGGLGRPHLAAALVEAGAAKSQSEAFARFLAVDAPGFVPKERLGSAEAIGLLRGAGAVPVLAHPGILGLGWAALDELLGRLRAQGLEGLEAYYGEADWPRQQRLITMAAKHGLAVSGGSDFHGAAKPGVLLGFGGGTLRVPASLLPGLRARRQRAPGEPAEPI